MKFLLKTILLGAIALTARADILRLRDGRMFTGNFLGATRSEIWFQQDTPGQFMGTSAYPVDQVESLTFGPVARQSGANHPGSSDESPFHVPMLAANRPESRPAHSDPHAP